MNDSITPNLLALLLTGSLALSGCNDSSSNASLGQTQDVPPNLSVDGQEGVEFCSLEPTPYDTEYEPKLRQILFSDLKNDVRWLKPGTPNIVIPPNPGNIRNQLFVFFPGSGNPPGVATKYLTLASYAGYHAIGLTFANQDTVSSLCKNSNNDNCHGDVLSERVYGEDTSDLVDVNSDNGIVNRLTLLINSLHTKKPDEGWGQYVKEGELTWNNIVVTGYSQGGKISAYISRDKTVARAIMFSGMGSVFEDENGKPQLMAWSQMPRNTPPERTYGLWHINENANAYAHLLLEAYRVNQYGGIVDIDKTAAPYGCSHMLRMGYTPGQNNPDAKDNCTAHRSTVADDCTPLDDNGVPLLAPAYLYMLTHQENR